MLMLRSSTAWRNFLMDACVCDVVGLSGSSDLRSRVAQYMMYRCASLSVGDCVEGHEAGSSM